MVLGYIMTDGIPIVNFASGVGVLHCVVCSNNAAGDSTGVHTRSVTARNSVCCKLPFIVNEVHVVSSMCPRVLRPE